MRTRFAPSPTGLLHLGNAYSALICQRWAEKHDAELLLRIEDIDHTRCSAEYADAIFKDLGWLGLHWQTPVRYQSRHLDDYQQAIRHLRDLGVIYPCFCSRKQITQEISRMASAPHAEDALPEYPGTCRNLHTDEQHRRMGQEPFAWRLNVNKAIIMAGEGLTWRDASGLRYAVRISHDIIIGRKDIAYSYHLAVVVDDALQGISHIIRGHDLRPSTGIHRLLQTLLELPEPTYIHHPLVQDSTGKRLTKRNHATTLGSLRGMGVEAKKLRDYLCAETTPHWPFAAEEKDAILHMLGKTQ
ncbi:MAG: tRNA glutamyl-Q(34) synthetase GluQRS [Mariprofundus sp.]|nr:tRNA glutamyl-Q(34) synthetase GluQRS [Mariprofundus sp.]